MVWHFEKCIVCGRVFLTMKKGQCHCSLACKEKKDDDFKIFVERANAVFREMEVKRNGAD